MHIHILGIAGTMTAALAIALKKEGHLVTGSDQDQIYPPISTILKKERIEINTATIDKSIDLAIIGSSYSSFQKTQEEYRQIKKLKINHISATQFVAQKLIKENSILVAGTYGKTTITSLLSWIFDQSNLQPNYMFGGKSLNYFPSVATTVSNWSIVEADESIHGLDKEAKFLYYPVKHLLLTSANWEHKDSYPQEVDNFNAFKKLVLNIPKDGSLFINSAGYQTKELSLYSKSKIITYNSPKSDYYLQKIKIQKKSSTLFIKTPKDIFEVKTTLLGHFNFENILAAVTVADTLNISRTKIANAILTYKGISRRLEKIYQNKDITIFDDFAQSSTRVKSTIEAIKDHYPKSNLKVFYQPHASFIQHQQSLIEFKGVFDLCKEVLLSKISFSNNIDKKNRVSAKDFKEVIGKKMLYQPIDQDVVLHYQKTLKKGDILICMGSGGLSANKVIKSIINSLK